MRRNRNCNRNENTDTDFKKSLVTYVLMLMFFGFLFLRVNVPSFVFFIIAIPMTISIIHKYIDTQNQHKDRIKEDFNEEDDILHEEDWEEEPLDLDDMKTLRKEWKDSDFV